VCQTRLKLSLNVNECKPLVPGLGQGRAVQVYPVKPTLKAPGSKRSRLKYDILLSSFAFKFNVRRYIQVLVGRQGSMQGRNGLPMVGRCRLNR